MNFFEAIGANRPLICAACAWTLAQVLKFFLYSFIEKTVSWRRLWGSGGMPSSHTAFTLALAVSIGLSEGFQTPAFAIAFALMGVVIYDAMGVRYETGKQGAVLNQILQKAGRDDYAMLTTIAGILVVLVMLLPRMQAMYRAVRDVFDL